jgi:hypothetical protein
LGIFQLFLENLFFNQCLVFEIFKGFSLFLIIRHKFSECVFKEFQDFRNLKNCSKSDVFNIIGFIPFEKFEEILYFFVFIKPTIYRLFLNLKISGI